MQKPGYECQGHLEEARRAAVEALELHIAGMIEDREAVPEGAKTLDAVMADAGNRDATAFLVDVPTMVKSVRLNVTLPENLVADIDRTTRNRSRWLADAAREKLRRA